MIRPSVHMTPQWQITSFRVSRSVSGEWCPRHVSDEFQDHRWITDHGRGEIPGRQNVMEVFHPSLPCNGVTLALWLCSLYSFLYSCVQHSLQIWSIYSWILRKYLEIIEHKMGEQMERSVCIWFVWGGRLEKGDGVTMWRKVGIMVRRTGGIESGERWIWGWRRDGEGKRLYDRLWGKTMGGRESVRDRSRRNWEVFSHH